LKPVVSYPKPKLGVNETRFLIPKLKLGVNEKFIIVIEVTHLLQRVIGVALLPRVFDVVSIRVAE